MLKTGARSISASPHSPFLLELQAFPLRHLCLARTKMTDKDGALLGPPLENNNVLLGLDLSNNDLAERSAKSLGSMLAVSHSLLESREA